MKTFFIPQIETMEFKKWIDLGHHIHAPIITPILLKKVIKSLKQKRKNYLSHLSTEHLLSTLAQVTQLWLSEKSPVRKEAEKMLTFFSGCSKAVIHEGLNLAFKEVQYLNLKENIERLAHFPKPRLSSFIFAGIIPTPMLFDIYLGLLLKSAIIVKCPSREPLFPILLAQSIHKIDPQLGACIAAFWWPGGKGHLEKNLFCESDLIHAYGNDPTVEILKSKTPPNKIFLGFGHKISFSVVSPVKSQKEAITAARKIAYDISLFDQQGCLSPHVIYVVKRGPITPFAWARTLSKAMEKMTRKLPSGKQHISESSKIVQIRGEYGVSKAEWLFTSYPSTDWTVIYEDTSEFRLSCLNRVIFVKPLNQFKDFPKLLKAWINHIQGLGFLVPDSAMPELSKMTKKMNIPYLLPIGRMQALRFDMHLDERICLLRGKKP